jgi:hypothetical protein
MKDESERYAQLKRRMDEDHEKWDKQTKDRKVRYQQVSGTLYLSLFVPCLLCGLRAFEKG